MMVGTSVAAVKREGGAAKGEPLLELDKASMPASSPFAVSLEGIMLSVRGGEVVGIAGVAGNGQSEFFKMVSGEATLSDPGAIRIAGKPAAHLGINERRRMGAAFVPEERLGHGAIPQMSLVAEHAAVAPRFRPRRLRGPGADRPHPQRRDARRHQRVSAAMDVRKSGDDPDASSLSGGNLQKFIMGRELDRQPRVFVVNQPTWGVDAGASAAHPPGAGGPCPRRFGRAGHQPGPR